MLQGDLGCRIHLKQLVLKLSNVRYDPNRFSSIIWQHRKIGWNCLVFSSGKLSFTGNVLLSKKEFKDSDDNTEPVNRIHRTSQGGIMNIHRHHLRAITNTDI